MSTSDTFQLGEHPSKPTVLLIDTNLIVAEATCMVLHNHNYHCISVGTVDEVLQQDSFDIIISALHIEGDFDAVDLIKRLHARKTCPVIFLTGELSARAQDHIQDLQPVAIIGKPYDDDTLLSALAAATSEPGSTSPQRPSQPQ